jgi:hypothetical protein
MMREKTSGIKLHIGIDTNGLPHAVLITTTEESYRDGTIETLRRYAPNLSKVTKVLYDGGYRGENFTSALKSLMGAMVICMIP